MAENYYHVVAFTGEGLRGNPAGVCLLTQPLPTERLQAIANEIGLPETSFVWDDGDMTAIRWFTPEREVDLCGHGTLAAAHVMFSAVNPALKDIRFRSAGGELFVKRDERDGERLVLDFPARPPQKVAEPAGLAALPVLWGHMQPYQQARLTAFLDHRLFRLLVAPTRAYLRAVNVAAQAFLRTAGRLVGTEALQDGMAFFAAFEGMEKGFRDRAARVQALLTDPSTAYVLIASPRADTVAEAAFFADRLEDSKVAVAALLKTPPHLPQKGSRTFQINPFDERRERGHFVGHPGDRVRPVGRVRAGGDRHLTPRQPFLIGGEVGLDRRRVAAACVRGPVVHRAGGRHRSSGRKAGTNRPAACRRPRSQMRTSARETPRPACQNHPSRGE